MDTTPVPFPAISTTLVKSIAASFTAETGVDTWGYIGLQEGTLFQFLRTDLDKKARMKVTTWAADLVADAGLLVLFQPDDEGIVTAVLAEQHQV